MNHLMSDATICALSTAAGGAMAIVRVSGPEAIRLTDIIFHSPSGRRLTESASHTAHYGELHDEEGNIIDDVVVTIFRAPRSYTGEDTTEISCHGSSYVISLILKRLIAIGCRQALPGEFTQRAFLNGKLDLSQAEAVADLISSTNAASHQMAVSQLRGHFSHQLAQLRDQLLHLTSLLELELDFSDHEDLEFADRDELSQLANNTEQKISSLIQSFAMGKALRQGIAVAIVGKTNVGKSTLLNRLLHDDKAIVSDIHGTTRDSIEDTTQIHGITYRFIDTAGIRHTSDAVERIGIERTYQKLEEATIVLWITDEPPSADEVDMIVEKSKGKGLIAVVNKIDKHGGASYEPFASLPTPPDKAITIPISAKHGTHIDRLEEAIFDASGIPTITQNDVIVTNIRHFEALTKAHEDIQKVIGGLEMNLSGDLLSEDLRACIGHLSEIVGGTITPDETLSNIFSHFCVGK